VQHARPLELTVASCDTCCSSAYCCQTCAAGLAGQLVAASVVGASSAQGGSDRRTRTVAIASGSDCRHNSNKYVVQSAESMDAQSCGVMCMTWESMMLHTLCNLRHMHCARSTKQAATSDTQDTGCVLLTCAGCTAGCSRAAGGEASWAGLAGQLVAASIVGASSALGGSDGRASTVAIASGSNCRHTGKACLFKAQKNLAFVATSRYHGVMFMILKAEMRAFV
jgi:hypothetical protein